MTTEQIKQRIIDNYTTEMEGGEFFHEFVDANFGVRADDYENMTNDILKEFEVIG